MKNRFISTVGLIWLSSSPANALIGYGIEMYNPPCAFACRASIAPAMLSCSDMAAHEGDGMMMMHGPDTVTTSECRAGDSSFLTTLAWCINSTCADFNVETWRLEKYWQEKTSGEPIVTPKWSFKEALLQITEPPEQELPEDNVLTYTAVVSHDSWNSERLSLEHFELAETLHSRYGIVVIVTAFGTPIVLTLLGYLPFMTSIFEKIKPYLVYPSLLGTYQIRPLPYLLGNAPTVGQSLYVALLLILNIVLTAVGYSASFPNNTWFASTWQEVMGYLTNRTGVLAFALAPIVILFSGRNNVLLWLTNWSHSTYMLLHRWVARIFALQVILHSICELVLYKDMGEYKTELKQQYWIWGAVATVATCVMLVASHLYLRRWSYTVFLVIHIILAVFVLVGSWYHVELLFTRKWGYQYWLYAAFAVWFFDRLIRFLRIAKVGIRRANVAEIGTEYVRVDIEGVRWSMKPGYHAYAYFPTLSKYTPWDNHPFSIIPTSMLKSHNHSIVRAGSPSSEERDIEKSNSTSATATTALSQSTVVTSGVSLYIKKLKGVTKFLETHNSLLTLLEGPYPTNHSSAVLKCDRLLLIGGGIGITGLLPWINCHLNVKLCWSVKDTAECIVQDLDSVLKGVAEKDVKIGQRLDINSILDEEEQAGWKKIGVVVCGPGGLCDDTRAAVVKAGRKGRAIFELEVDAFSW